MNNLYENRNMMKIVCISMVLSMMLFLACAKDEPKNLTAVCESGDMWMVNQVDTFPIRHVNDTFRFIQGGGYHQFSWRYSFANALSVEVFAIPDSSESIIYKKSLVRNLKIQHRGFEYVMSAADFKDSMFQITNFGTYYQFRMNDVLFKYAGRPDIKVRACDLRMEDVAP
jgi:hypothetical protein